MDEILSKISSYNIFNYLFPGAVFTIIADQGGLFRVPANHIVEQLLWYYFVGLVISRVGSVVLEPLLKRISFVRYSDYPSYLSACAADPNMGTMVEVSNMYRTLATTFALLLVSVACAWVANWIGLSHVRKELIILLLLFVLFLFSFKKQSNFVSKRVDHFRTKI